MDCGFGKAYAILTLPKRNKVLGSLGPAFSTQWKGHGYVHITYPNLLPKNHQMGKKSNTPITTPPSSLSFPMTIGWTKKSTLFTYSCYPSNHNLTLPTHILQQQKTLPYIHICTIPQQHATNIFLRQIFGHNPPSKYHLHIHASHKHKHSIQ